MGVSFSDLNDLKGNSLLKRFLFEDIDSGDPFWNQFLSFEYTSQYTKIEDEKITKAISSSGCFRLSNIYALMDIIHIQSREIKENSIDLKKNSIFLKQFYNALIVFRYSLKLLQSGRKSINDEYSNSLCKILENFILLSLHMDLNSITYLIHVEIVTIWNYVLYSDLLNLQLDVILEMFSQSYFQDFTKKLLMYITKEKSLETIDIPNMEINSNSAYFSGLLEVVSFGWYNNSADKVMGKSHLLSEQAVFLLLKLSVSQFSNMAKLFLCNMTDGENIEPCTFNFYRLFKCIEAHFDKEYFLLFLYILLNKNANFRKFVLSQEKFLLITIPLLKNMYFGSGNNLNAVYMSLIILLILSEDGNFIQIVNKEVVKDVSWIKEKVFYEISLGSLIVWILCRMVQNNLFSRGDKYIQTNCLAALANMSSKFSNLHGHAAEQIMVMIKTLQKKRNSIVVASTISDDSKNEITNIEESLQTIIEIINSALIFSLTKNPEMIHTFLYHRKQFLALKEIPNIKAYANNIDSILSYFTSKLEKEFGNSISSEKEVLKIIKKYSPSIDKFNNFKSFPELKYKYVEEDSADDFFIPYLWKMFTEKSFIFWNLSKETKDDLTCVV